MANTIEYENIDKELKYTNLSNPQVFTGFPLSLEPYEVEDGKLKKHPKSLINAIDINWGGASVKETPINTTDDLLYLLNNADFGGGGSSGGGEEGGSIEPIDPNSMIFIMLNAIRALQSEVTKLRNSFRFGINSYSDEEFGMSERVNSLSNTQEEEPLWATDESELEFIEGLDLSQQGYQYITPIENFEILPNDRLKYNGDIIFTIPQDNEGNNILEVSVDPKHYAYITSSTKDIDIILKSGGKTLTFNINDIVQDQYAPEKYNILVIVSKKVEYKNKDEETEFVGNNFVWVSVSAWQTGKELFNGYILISGEANEETGIVNYETSETPEYLKDIYNLNEIDFHTKGEDYIYKLDIYSNYYQDFTKPIMGAPPTDVEDYKYRTAAITIRSMSSKDKIEEHVNELQNNELIYCEANKKLYIYSNGNLINIGTGGDDGSGDKDIMENYQILKALEEQGVITIQFIDDMKTPAKDKYDPTNIESYILSNKFNINSNLDSIEKINFINGDTGKSFDVTMSPYGQFDIREKHTSIIEEKNGTEITHRTISSMAEYIQKPGVDAGTWIDDLPLDYHSDRGFVSLLKGLKKDLDFTSDMGLNGDHIEIGAVYAPLKTDKIHGCTHGYIELFNASDEDFYLDGCYLHYSYAADAGEVNADHIIYKKLALNGYIPAGGTYLIRCKKYAEPEDPNVFINVKTYDIEWYIGENELLDLSMNKAGGISLALTYGYTYQDKNENGDLVTKEIDQSTNFTKTVPTGASNGENGYILSGGDNMLVILSTLIDSKCIGEDWSTAKDHWVPVDGTTYKARVFKADSNTLYKVTFALDPAKQAFQSMTTKDSSRRRWANSANDEQFVSLNREFIEFPKTKLVKAVADYTPKASFEYKNVITDKSKLDKDKPNAIVCSYGINPYITRCFNWVSSGLFNEAVVIINPDDNKEYKFESYTTITTANTQKTDKIHRKEFSVDINNAVYARIYDKFPGNNEPYTSHKCIIEINETDLQTPKTYQYYICRLDSNNNIDNNYKSDIRSFTLYPKTYQPKVYQITDQQGFHWVEYQVWTATAQVVNDKIIADQETEQIMPVIINTGDCVQSGARVNEWLDYFNGGDVLFKHFEQNNIVGNNDLCDTNINKLGTGDDTGKSNGYFFHLFNCYEIPTDTYTPICKEKYIPSLYYVDLDYITDKSNDIHKNIRILFINSEITYINCRDWFNIKDTDNNPINIYTGFNVNVEKLSTFTQTYLADEIGFKPIYEILYQWTNDNNKTYLPVCHEMPFTVVTNACLSWTNSYNQYSRYRSLSDAKNGKLIGSHTNQIADVEDGKGMHWMSRLFEYRNITLCLGGHKHTYACTYPVRENYLYIKHTKLSSAEATALNNLHLINDENGNEPSNENYITTYEDTWIKLNENDIYKEKLSSAEATALNNLYLINDENENEPSNENYITTYEDTWKELHENDIYGVNQWSYINGSMVMPVSLKDDTATWKISANVDGQKTINLSKFPIVKRQDAHKTLDIDSISYSFDIYNNPMIVKISTDSDNAKKRFYPFVDCKTKKVLIPDSNGKNPGDTGYITTYKLIKDKNGIEPTSKYTQEEADEYNTSNNLEEGAEGYVTTNDYKNGYIETFAYQFDDDNQFVIYDMSQATGYKLTSNKELPSEFQKFSMVIPKTTTKISNGKFSDTASADQQMPMFGIIDLLGDNKYDVKVARVNNISSEATKMTFKQGKVGKNTATIEYLCMACGSLQTYLYGFWCKYYKTENEIALFKQTDVSTSGTLGLQYTDASNKVFKVVGNESNILYPNLVTSNGIYLFKTYDMF